MPTKEDVERQVERLLQGERRVRDLDSIFGWLRFHHKGLKTVAEIGDMAAHKFEKDKGVVWERLRRFWTMAEYHFVPVLRPEQAIPRTVARFRDTAMAAVDAQSEADCRRLTALSKKRVRKIVVSGLKKVISIDGNTYMFGAQPTHDEERLIKLFCNLLVVEGMATAQTLIIELADCLLKNGIIEKRQVGAVHALREFVGIYAIEQLHGATVAIGDATSVELNAGYLVERHETHLVVFGRYPVSGFEKETGFRVPIFTTNFEASKWVDPDVIAAGDIWDFPLEMSPEGILQRL
jgi:hypothetical protein